MSIAGSNHLELELLSAYLDQELDRQQTGILEDHLRKCVACRHELEQLRRVVHRLRELDRDAPPPALELTVQRRVALQRREESLLEKLERRLPSVPFQPSIGVTFALVVAFAVMMYLLAAAVERRQAAGIPVILDPESYASEEGRIDQPSILTLGRWIFRYEDGKWRQAGLSGQSVSRVLEWDSPEAGDLLASHPELAPLAALGEPVLLVVEAGSVVEVRPAAPRDGDE